jgi:hypothetical protein
MSRIRTSRGREEKRRVQIASKGTDLRLLKLLELENLFDGPTTYVACITILRYQTPLR